VIYRLIGETERLFWDEDGNLRRGTGELRGAMLAMIGDFGDLKAPHVTNPRARFWFTEAGWKEYGRCMVADAHRCGRTFRLLVRKNPPRSAVVYRDKWQLALLPVKGKR
jgi:hypothetical protein